MYEDQIQKPQGFQLKEQNIKSSLAIYICHMRYAHTNIIAQDWKKLVEFYTQVFDCTLKPPLRKQSGEWLARGTGVPHAALEGAHLLLPGHGENGPTLEIYHAEVLTQIPIPANQRGLGHLAFEVDDVKAVLKQLVAHGGTCHGKVIKREVPEVGLLTFTYARDPEGNLIELQSWA